LSGGKREGAITSRGKFSKFEDVQGDLCARVIAQTYFLKLFLGGKIYYIDADKAHVTTIYKNTKHNKKVCCALGLEVPMPAFVQPVPKLCCEPPGAARSIWG